MKNSSFLFLKTLIERRTGIVLTEDKIYLLEARFSPICKANGFAGLDELCAALQRGPDRGLVDELIERITTNETSFFRDREPFMALEREILPALIDARRSERSLRIWSAACSSGQEAYSLSMILTECFPELGAWDVQIVATDISTEMVERCNAGLYTQHEVSRGLTPERLRTHFEKTPGGRFAVAPKVAERVEAQQLNLLEPFPAGFRFDLVLMRNVLIYFDQATRDRILSRVHGTIRQGGYLMLGTAEAPRGEQFQRADVGSASVFQRAA